MADELRGIRVACLNANEGVEQVELVAPRDALQDAGATVVVVAPQPGEIQAMNHLDKADTFPVDRTVSEVTVDDFDALLLPGGVANPDQLRTDPGAVQLVRGMIDAGKPVAVICHGPWTLVEADAVRGRTITSWPSLRTDIRNAGGTWVDEQVVVCEKEPSSLVSSRKPDDLPEFCRVMVSTFADVSQQPA
jgi:protease I